MSDAFAQPQQDRSRDAMRRIVVAAVDLFSAQGFEATRVSDIAKRAGVPVGTVYQRFQDKEALLTSIVTAYRACRMREIGELCTSREAHAASPRQLVELHLDIVFSAFTCDAGLLRMLERRRLEDPTVHKDQSDANEVVASLVADRLAEKLPGRDEGELRRQVLYLHSIVRGAVVWSTLPVGGELGRGLKVTDVDFAREALLMALRYLRIAEEA
ncbi:TetR/AcrR family transcriptional regulator [Novosphingobium marinum]|uniref:AcrR family transcriptional regulator n=1 Tax=Novosphingobium marinum TaxID=1514948 RepID=A0A7Z0BTX5_9SPHN|nr:TetR/AcrR family transcriptional regulator [Novosphingobium marinum]NYH93712.1 AcrR family transcriptional regulator [Novosphingobium marinum]